MSLIFEWDPRKAATNVRKHGIEFQDAIAVFDDPLARIFPDAWHSHHEPREIIIRHLRDRRLCLVVFTEIVKSACTAYWKLRAVLHQAKSRKSAPN